jgi:peroxiredoxin
LKNIRYALAGIVALGLLAGMYTVFTTSIAGKTAPDVAYTLLDGSNSNLQSLRGKVVLVNFWATDCEPCVREMPQIVATHEKFRGRGFETLAVAMSYNAPALVINFAERRKLPFGVVIDNTGAVARGFGHVDFTPTSVLIDKRGHIVKRIVGEPDFPALDKLVEKLLAQT